MAAARPKPEPLRYRTVCRPLIDPEVLTINTSSDYPIGLPGVKWGATERAEWLARQAPQRFYADDVLAKLPALARHFALEQYGALSFDADRYPLFALKSQEWDAALPVALVTGGVHGYETSGVQGAVRFLETRAVEYVGRFNLVVAPCVSPWAYETINRWNPQAVDPNRSFKADTPSEEARLLMQYVEQFASKILVHVDLHETTDTDNSEFRPALAARDGVQNDDWIIPDGFYLVGDREKPEPEFQRAVIAAVERVTHIAPADENAAITGIDLEQRGVISFDAGPLGLCMGMTNADYVTTTEVYPDSPGSDAENCIAAQVAAVVGALDYVARTRIPRLTG